jgi:hypothetical protein
MLSSIYNVLSNTPSFLTKHGPSSEADDDSVKKVLACFIEPEAPVLPDSPLGDILSQFNAAYNFKTRC